MSLQDFFYFFLHMLRTLSHIAGFEPRKCKIYAIKFYFKRLKVKKAQLFFKNIIPKARVPCQGPFFQE